jgi:hypothetical protein
MPAAASQPKLLTFINSAPASVGPGMLVDLVELTVPGFRVRRADEFAQTATSS